ncbi:MAG TPA: ABC transporter substrate-binding protein [Xanthobacteraceae bacterium]|nr:ABC transporter substrate-binding protein [Xanthobacteraceae bacterium]
MLKEKAGWQRLSNALAQTAALCVFGVGMMVPAGTAQAEPMTTLRVAYIPVVTWLPALVAKEDGIFEKNGLDVVFTKFPNVINLPGTLGKQFDLVPTTAPDLLNAAAGGLNIAAVSGETVEDSANKSFQVIVKADSGINSMKDLAGKRVAGPGVGSVMHLAMLYQVAKEGGDPSTVIGLEAPFTAMLDQLKSGRVDAVEPLEPFVGQMLGAGFKSIGDPLLAVADPVLFPFWIADADWARAHGDALKRWRSSLEGGLASIRADEGKARKILATYSGLPEAVVARIPLPHYEFNITPEELDVWRKALVSQGAPLKDLDVKRLVITAQ